jgi:hypothetical protein
MGGQFIVYSRITQFANSWDLEVRLLPTEFGDGYELVILDDLQPK